MHIHDSKLVAFFLAIAPLPAMLHGQEADSTRRWSVGSTRAFVGATQLGLDDLNAQLAANGRPTFANTVTVIGFASSVRRGRVLLGASIENSLPESHSAEGWRTRLSTNAGALDAGLAAFENERVLLSPVASLGIRHTSVRMTAEGDFDFQDGLRDPARSLELSSLGGFVRLGLAAEWRAHLGSTRPISIGMEGGMLRSLGGATTIANDRSVRGTPRQGSGGYLRFDIGMPMRQRQEALGALSAAVGTAVLR